MAHVAVLAPFPRAAVEAAIGGGVADYLFDHGICLPSGSGMTESQQDRVIDALSSVVRSPAAARVA